MAPNNPNMRDLIRLVESAGEVISEAEEKLLYPPTVYDGEGNEHSYDIYHDVMANKEVGDTVSSSAAAPGYGGTVDRITRMDDTGVYGVQIKNTVQIMEPWMVEDENDDFQPIEKKCPDCGGTGEAHHMSDSPFPYLGYECDRCDGEGTVNESKPYATMKDGPDKYLFRKDGKQKLVGSADNEPENGEEELEETDMDKDIREMQIAAGIIVAEDEAIEEETVDEEAVDEEIVDEGKLPDALKKHQFGAKDDDDSDDDDSDDDDSDDDDSDDDKEEVDEEISNWMKRFDRLDGPVNEEVVDEDEHRKGAGETECKYCNSKDCDYDCDESQAGGFDESVNEDCPTDPDKNADGECSPLTHIELDEDDFEEDLLLAPQDSIGPEVDEDDMIYGEPGRGKSYGPKDFDKFGGDDYEMGEGQHSDDSSAMECPRCKDIALVSKGITGDLEEFECDSCGNYQTMPPMTEHSPGEFDHDPDAMIDVGDKEDFEVYDFDNEFETMLGGSSDPVDNFGAGSMYEMNEIRKLAGLEPIEEKKDDRPDCPQCDGEGYGEDEDSPDHETGACSMCGGSGKAKVDKKLDEEDFGALHSGHLDPVPGDVVAYDIADERAYYLMADILGAELDFGPQDEILVPAERNDEICAELTKQGFEQGRDFKVAGQMMDDLQNGYNDRAFTKGQDYFPRGAQSTPASDLGPSASGMADNPMSNKMRMVQKDEVYETMKLSYRRHRKNDIAAPKKSNIVTEDISLASIAFDLAAGGFIGWALVTAWPKVKEYLEIKKHVDVLADFEEQVSPEAMKNFADKLEAKLVSTHPNSRKAIAGRIKSIEAKLNAIPNTETYHGLVRAIELLRGEMRRAEQFVKKSNTGHGRRADKKRR